MNFYLLDLKNNNGYDINQARVVRAKNEENARRLANETVGDEGPVWEDPEEVSCDLLDPNGPEEVILSDYKAG